MGVVLEEGAGGAGRVGSGAGGRLLGAATGVAAIGVATVGAVAIKVVTIESVAIEVAGSVVVTRLVPSGRDALAQARTAQGRGRPASPVGEGLLRAVERCATVRVVPVPAQEA